MKAASQVIVSLASLATALFIGALFDTAFWQAGIFAKHFRPGVPLPVGTEFLIHNHQLVRYLLLLPWLWLVGAPLLTSDGVRSYWNASAFILRYLAFFSCELFLLLGLLLLLFIPYIPYYGLLVDYRQTTSELAARLIFWGCIGVIVLACLRRVTKRRFSR